MDNAQPGPSGLQKRSRNIFDVFQGNESDSDDDFDIPHVSDDSGSSSSSEDEGEDTIWRSVEMDSERDRQRFDPAFTVRNSNMPRNLGDGVRKPIDYFSLFFSEPVLMQIVRYTNLYAAHFLSQPQITEWIEAHPSSRYRHWKDVTLEDIKAYLAILLNMGITKRNIVSTYWSTRKSQKIDFYGGVMAYNKFVLISRMLHVSDVVNEKPRGDPDFDPWAKVRPILSQINETFKYFYTPSQNISIDESMIGMKNRCAYIQFMPNKRHARFGVKKFELCDSNGYVYHVELYAGKDFDVTHDEGQAFAVVKQLMEVSNLLQKGYRLFTDNFYTKVKLAEFLLENNTILCGTIRSNSKDLPPNMTQKLAVGQTRYWRKNELLAISFREKKSQRKNVLVLTTGHNSENITKQIRGKVVNKPAAILDYNSYMGGVDLSDKKVYHLAAERPTRRYWKKNFQNFIDMSIVNAHILYNLRNPDNKMHREKFVIEILEMLCNYDPTPTPGEQPAGFVARVAEHRLVLLDGKKEWRCYVCSEPKKRRRSRHYCPACNVGCHERCEPQLQHQTGLGNTPKRKRTGRGRRDSDGVDSD